MLRGLHFKVLIVAGLLSLIPAAARATDNTQGTACSGTATAAISGSTTGASVVSPAGGNNLVCIGGTWQYPVYQFGSTSAACSSTNAGAVQYSGGAMQYCNGSAWLPFSSSCYGSSSGSDTSLASSLVAYWKFDENAGLTLYDATGNGNTGTFQRGGSQWAAGKLGYGLQFDGTNYVTTNAALGSFGTTDFTVAGWYKTTQTSLAYVVSKRSACYYDNFFDIDLRNGEIGVELDDSTEGNLYTLTDASTTADGNWHHFAFVRSGASILLYRDGSSVASASTGSPINISGSAAAAPILTLATNPCSGNYVGSLDEVGIWGVALTTAQVSALYNAGSGNSYGSLICPAVVTGAGFTN